MRRLAALALAAGMVAPGAALAGTVTVKVGGIQRPSGVVRVAVCDKARFGGRRCPFQKSAPARTAGVSLTFEGVPAGRFAVMVFQDADGDGKLKFSPLGPAEPYGFSGQNPRIPNFEAAAIDVEAAAQTVAVRLR